MGPPDRGLLAVSWIAAGLLGTLVGGLGWVAYGTVRISGFRHGTPPDTAIALAVVGAIYLLGAPLQQ